MISRPPTADVTKVYFISFVWQERGRETCWGLFGKEKAADNKAVQKGRLHKGTRCSTLFHCVPGRWTWMIISFILLLGGLFVQPGVAFEDRT